MQSQYRAWQQDSRAIAGENRAMPLSILITIEFYNGIVRTVSWPPDTARFLVGLCLQSVKISKSDKYTRKNQSDRIFNAHKYTSCHAHFKFTAVINEMVVINRTRKDRTCEKARVLGLLLIVGHSRCRLRHMSRCTLGRHAPTHDQQ